MDKINILASEIRRIRNVSDGPVKMPMSDDDSTTATAVEVELEGSYKFQAIAVSLPGHEEPDLLVNLSNGMVLELLPTKPYSTEDADSTEVDKATLELLLKKTYD